jgi:hypothetical protein
MECWNQADMDVSGRILRTWMAAMHAGMTKLSIFMFCGRAQDHESLRGIIAIRSPRGMSRRVEIQIVGIILINNEDDTYNSV